MSIRDLTRIDRATVLKAGRRAATLLRSAQGISFCYDADYDGPPVAHTLPVTREPVVTAAGAVPPFFAGLLPEGRRLIALRRALKTSADDELSLLLAVGANAIGDVQVVPDPAPPLPLIEPKESSLSEVRFAELFSRAVGDEPADLAALPGVQDKISSAMISLPMQWRGSPFILKLDPPRFRHLVENEVFFVEAARTSGLRVTDAQLVHDADGQPGLLVRRFDRHLVGSAWQRLAQEDGCQVMGRYPADKYRLSSEVVLGALATVTDAPVVAARHFVEQLAFAYLSCNGDAHAKNFSVLQAPDGEWEASPAYDLPSSHPYGDHTMALSIAGKEDNRIGRQDFVELGVHLGLPERATNKTLDRLTDAVDAWLPDLETLPFDERTTHKLRRAIEHRRQRLAA